MHFSIPDTQDMKDDSGSSYVAYNIHINGCFHCTVRYKQLHNLHDQLKKAYGSTALPLFPPKKLLPLTSTQTEERRSVLEKYIQRVSQDARILSDDIFTGFLLSAQQESQNVSSQEVDFDVFLVNWQKVMIRIVSTDPTDVVLDAVARAIGLPADLVCYFTLFLVKKVGTDIIIKKRMENFEAPYLSQVVAGPNHCVIIRKSYWDSGFDQDLLEDAVSLNLLYVQALSDLERGWVVAAKETHRQLSSLQAKGSKKEYLHLARTLKYYGYIQFSPCVCDYPRPNTRALISAGGRELNFRLQVSQGEVKEVSFRVTRIRCWRIITSVGEEEEPKADKRLELSFEYLVSKTALQWITVVSDQAILLSMCLQGMVGELLLKKNGSTKPAEMQRSKGRRGSWSFMKRDGSSYQISVSRSASSDGILQDTREDTKKERSVQDKTCSMSLPRDAKRPSPKATVENDAFEGIGDDDL
ncbi:sorting nexin-17-like [Ornithodoros turicata]|uniref:Putative sorting nexin n=1 Tax=Ornithodoros turicata TaxID=34597 RepID=A0A2R5LC33_9ACAR